MVRRAAALLFILTVPAFGQSLDEIAGLVNRGKLNVAVNLKQGTAALTPQWTVQAVGTPKAIVTVEADEGRVRCLDVDVTDGKLLIAGKGLRPALWIEAVRFEDGAGIVSARFRGRGIWRPIVAIVGAVARPALRRLDIPTDIRSILSGDIVKSEKSSSESSSEFLTLVRDVQISNSEFEAFNGYPIAFGDLLGLDTKSLRLAIDKGKFTPPARFEVDGRLDGEIENGAASFVGSHCRFSHGRLQRGRFHVADNQVSVAAEVLELDLSNGQFHWPGGPKVGVEAPSHFVVRNLRVRPDGSYSGTVDAALFGKVGTIDRGGTSVAANDVSDFNTA
ncbi:MAG: hypothetical protein DMF59_13025 [Acidobacteria bacterium]|nr:MAG: hypothetical protein DMF59_13025 [Acidobacteriota bacterium]